MRTTGWSPFVAPTVPTEMSDANKKNLGSVYLVGAGPGDPGLITIRGLQLLESADVVVHDRLVDPRMVALCADTAEVIDVGKAPRGRRGLQQEVNELLIARAREGKSVVRLKGGDPFVFGRGGEEAEALAEAGVTFEVVPGVTSAVAAPAYAGIPLTHRGVASSATIVTGSEAPDKEGSDIDWEILARSGGTLVVLMGFENLESIAASLVQGGRGFDTPVALVQWGSQPTQHTVVGTLADIGEKAARAGLSPPVVAVIGEVVALREKLRWFDNRPLFGKRVLVTRSRTQASSLSEMLSREGGQPIELPTIETRPLKSTEKLDAALAKLSTYDWVLFTSANTVTAVFERLVALGMDARAFGTAKVGAIGQATASALSGWGILSLDFLPDRPVSESVVEGLEDRGLKGSKVLVPGARVRRDTLRRGLERLGALVDDIAVYETTVPEKAEARAREVLAPGVDAVTFTSTSTVSNLADLLNGDLSLLGDATIACIGPITAEAARETGLRVEVVPEQSTVAGLVESLKMHFENRRPSDG